MEGGLYLVAFPRNVEDGGGRVDLSLLLRGLRYTFVPGAKLYLVRADFSTLASFLAFRAEVLLAGEGARGLSRSVVVRVSSRGVEWVGEEPPIFPSAHVVVCRHGSALELSIAPVLSWSRRILTLAHVRKELLVASAQGESFFVFSGLGLLFRPPTRNTDSASLLSLLSLLSAIYPPPPLPPYSPRPAIHAVSTLGGGYFLTGQISHSLRMAKTQEALATLLGDRVMAAQSRVHLAYNLCQRGRFKASSFRV